MPKYQRVVLWKRSTGGCRVVYHLISSFSTSTCRLRGYVLDLKNRSTEVKKCRRLKYDVRGRVKRVTSKHRTCSLLTSTQIWNCAKRAIPKRG